MQAQAKHRGGLKIPWPLSCMLWSLYSNSSCVWSPSVKTTTDNWHDERNSAIENWHINNSRKDDRELKATERPIAITYKDNKKDFEKDDLKKEDLKTLKITLTGKKETSAIEIMQQKNDIERQKIRMTTLMTLRKIKSWI